MSPGTICAMPPESQAAPPSPPAASQSTLAPLRLPVFRMLWLTWLFANTCMWMNDVAAAWLMTSLTTSPLYVALVQTASTLPVFLLGLPSGALADILDRRRYFIATQFWVAIVAIALCAAILAGGMTAPLLLALGLTEFSLHPATLLEVRKAIRDSDLSALQARSRKLLQARDRAGIEHWLKSVAT